MKNNLSYVENKIIYITNGQMSFSGANNRMVNSRTTVVSKPIKSFLYLRFGRCDLSCAIKSVMEKKILLYVE